MPLININGVNLHYDSKGKGKAIVCLHGYTSNSSVFSGQLSGLALNYKVVTYDLRGHGKSEAPSREEDYHIPVLAKDLLELLKFLDIKECCLIGHSGGGHVALQFAMEHQDMLKALVFISTSSEERPRTQNYYEHRKRIEEIARDKGIEAAFEYDSSNSLDWKEQFKKHPEQKEEVRKRVLSMSVDGYIYIVRARAKRENLTPRLNTIHVPTLIFWGDQDFKMSNSVQVLKRGIPGSELAIIKGAGHLPQWENPAEFNNILVQFLNRINW